MCIEATTSDVGAALQELLPASFTWVGEDGGDVIGAPFTRYLEIAQDPPSFRIQAGVPTSTEMAVEGRATAIVLPGGDVAVATHFGPYETVVETASALREYAQAQGRQPSGPLWESYVSDPGEEPDPGKWQTEVCLPLS